MSQHYLYESDEDSPTRLPSLEVFWMSAEDIAVDWIDGDGDPMGPGWYWWTCLPGCLPDSDPFGPYDSEDAALLDAREGLEDLEDDGT